MDNEHKDAADRYSDPSTSDLMDKLKDAKSAAQLDSYMESINGKYSGKLSEYLRCMMDRKNVDTSWLVKNAYLERTYAYQILNGKRNPTKDKIVMIALALEMSLIETQRALEISHAGILYPKDERDSVLIYAVEHSLNIRDTNVLLSKYKMTELQ